jgi:mannosyltransferase
MLIQAHKRQAVGKMAPQASPVTLAPPSPHRDLPLLLLLTLLALALRLLGRGQESIWYDEAASLDMARASALDLITGRKLDAGNPAGYFLLLHGWLSWLGFTIENARALSALAGALSVPAVWLLARACALSRGAALLGALLVAVSPPLVYLGQEARAFALFATVATLAAAAVARAERGGGILSWVGFAVAGVVLVHLHYYGAFVLTALGLHLLFWGWRHDRRAILKLAGCALAVGLAFLPWLPSFRLQLALGTARSEGTWWQHLALLPLSSTAGRTLVWKEDGTGAVAAADLAIAALVFLPLTGLFARLKPRPWLLVVFVAGVPLLAALVSVLLTPMIHSHYLAAVFPAGMLLLAATLEGGWKKAPKALAWLPALFLAAVLPAALVRMYTVPHKTDWRGVADLVGRHGENLPVYFYEDIGADPFSYYRPEQSRHCILEPFGQDGWRRTAAEMQGDGNGFWVVVYPTHAATKAELSRIGPWLEKRFIVEEQATFPPLPNLYVWRCRPCP